MSNQSLREAEQQALECKRLAHDYASACAGCDPEDFAAKERDEMYAAIDKLARLAWPAEQSAELKRLAQAAREAYFPASRHGHPSFDKLDPSSVEAWERVAAAVIAARGGAA